MPWLDVGLKHYCVRNLSGSGSSMILAVTLTFPFAYCVDSGAEARGASMRIGTNPHRQVGCAGRGTSDLYNM